MKDLFETIQSRIACDYISDFHFGETKRMAIDCTSRFPVSRFPLSQWNDLVCYFWGEHTDFQCKQDVKKIFAEKQTSKISVRKFTEIFKMN